MRVWLPKTRDMRYNKNMTQDNENPSPALSGTPYTISGCEIQVHADNPYSTPYVVAKAGDGETITIPSKFLEALGYQAARLGADGFEIIDKARREHLGIFEDPRLEATQRGGIFALKEQYNGVAEGIPLIAWTSRRGDYEKSGWRLTLSGAEQATVGFAQWDDSNAVENLIGMMSDPETVITMAGMNDPEIISQLSARMTAVSMRASRSLPRINLPKVRKVLVDAGVVGANGSSGRTKAEAARMRLLNVKVGDVKVPVAVAINPPLCPAGFVGLSEEEQRALSWPERQQRLTEMLAPLRTEWLRRVREEMEAKGWRLIELPRPRQPWGHREMECLWVTLIDANTWSGLSAAATREAGQLEMTRGGTL